MLFCLSIALSLVIFPLMGNEGNLEEKKINLSEKQDDFYQIINECLNRPKGWPPLAYAVKLKRYDVVKFLLDHGEDVNASTPNLPLWYESSSCHTGPSCIGNLLQGYTPLELAISYEDVEMIKILTTYHPNNRANPHLIRTRYTDLDA